MKRRVSEKLSAFEVSERKGDSKLLKDTPHKLTLEGATESLFILWQYLGSPEFDNLHWISIWWVRDFNRKEAAAKLNITVKTLNKRIERLSKVYRQSACLLTLEDAISGIFTLWGRLNCVKLKRLCWVYTWWAEDFSREKTAFKLNIAIELMDKRIERLKADYDSSESRSERGSCLPENIRKMIKELREKKEDSLDSSDSSDS